FTLRGNDADRIGIRTDALLVVHQGALFYERYARGYDATSPHLAWSVTKTITQLLTGAAVQAGALGVDDSICTHLPRAPAPPPPPAAAAPAPGGTPPPHPPGSHSGFDGREAYEGAGPRQAPSVIAMLYGKGKDDWARFFLQRPPADPPGTAYRYSTGDLT